MPSFRRRFSEGFTAVAVLAATMACPALGQGLPADVGRRLDRALENRVVDGVERRVDDTVSRQIGDIRAPQLPPLPEIPAKVAAPPGGLTEPVQGLAAGVTGTLTSAGDVLAGVTGAAPGRAIALDTAGGWPVVRDEWILIASAEDAARLEASGVRILEDTPLSSSGERLLILSLGSDDPGAGRIETRLREFGAEMADRNHIYVSAAPGAQPDLAEALPAAAHAPGADGAGHARLGLIDTDVDETHPSLSRFPLLEQDFVSMGALRPQGHGTAVASILARELSPSPRAQPVLAASVFFLAEDGTTGATSASLVRALDWMIAEQVAVINFSLAGPPNRALEVMIERGLAAGIVIVAAVGNEGPAARPLYPAAYPGVIGVTAVDSEGQVYRWANRGSQVAVAARGVDVEVARPGGLVIRDSGTSFAAPVVSAWMALELAAGSPAAPFSLIAAAAKPPAVSRRDAVYGYGILDPAGHR